MKFKLFSQLGIVVFVASLFSYQVGASDLEHEITLTVPGVCTQVAEIDANLFLNRSAELSCEVLGFDEAEIIKFEVISTTTTPCWSGPGETSGIMTKKAKFKCKANEVFNPI